MKKLTQKNLKIHGIRMKTINLSCKNMNIPSGLNGIQPRATQVWKYDEIGFDPNGRWNKVIYTYKLFQGERMWKVQTVE